MAVNDGSPDDDKISFVFQDACDETSCIASWRRASEETSKGRFDQGAAGSGQWKVASSRSQDWSSGKWESSWNSGKSWNSRKDTSSDWWKKHERGIVVAWQEESAEEGRA